MKKILFLIITLFALFPFVDTYGQEIDMSELKYMPAPHEHEVCTLNPTDFNAFYYMKPDEQLLKLMNKASGTIFEVDYIPDAENSCSSTSWPQEAINAFEYALNIWALHIHSDVPLRVRASWRNFETDDDRITLGGASPSRIVQLPGVGIPNTWYSLAHLTALSGEPIRDRINNLNHDISVNMNCNFDRWYFGTDGNTPENLIDFVTVVLHEIGHGIGFIGSISSENDSEIADWGSGDPPAPFIFDRFAVDGDFHDLIDTNVYGNPSSDLFEAITGNRGGIFLDGNELNQTLLGEAADRARLFSPSEYLRGSTYSHFDQTTFTNTPNSLMRPSIDRATAIHTPGPLFCGFLRDMEWPLGEACLRFLSPYATVTLASNKLNFGVTSVGDLEERSLLIRNDLNSDEELQIRATIDDSQFTLLSASEFVIPAGSEFSLPMAFRPTSDGIKQATLTLDHNAKNTPSPVTVQLKGESLPASDRVRLDQSYPNPVVNISTGATISYALVEESHVLLDLYTVTGQHVRSIVNARQQSGRYDVNVDLSGLSSGIYLYRIVVDNEVSTKKLMLFR